MKTQIREYKLIKSLTQGILKNKHQLNKVFESDCEFVSNGKETLAISTDAIGEEIDISLYKNPELWGWMTAIISISDLTVSGASPLGILLNNQWKYGTQFTTKKEFFNGFKKALKKTRVPLIGGDSGTGASHCHSSTIIGKIAKQDKILNRLGILKDDVLCLSSKNLTGIGPALAFEFLLNKKSQKLSLTLEDNYRPCPNLSFGPKLAKLAHASIDTSDGIASSLQILKELNSINFELYWNNKIISPKALHFCYKNNLHPLMLWMGDHGDYQSLYIIPHDNIKKTLKIDPHLQIIGKAIEQNSKKPTYIHFDGKKIELPIELATQIPRDTKGIYKFMMSVNKYLNKL